MRIVSTDLGGHLPHVVIHLYYKWKGLAKVVDLDKAITCSVLESQVVHESCRIKIRFFGNDHESSTKFSRLIGMSAEQLSSFLNKQESVQPPHAVFMRLKWKRWE